MKNIQLTKLEITNYRNIEHAEYDFDGNSKIIGENRIGKTNTLEAICFLLTDKLLDGSSDLASIKPTKDTKLEVIVKGTFLVDDKKITIEKHYGENWVKTRGTSEMVFKGHYEDYFYNDVKQGTLKAYNQLFLDDFGINQAEISNVDIVRMLINPFYLGELGEDSKWSDLRNFIIKLVGDVSDEDIFKKDPTLTIIKDDLSKSNGRIDQVKKSYKVLITGLEEQILGDNSKIEMLSKTDRPTDDEIALANKMIEESDEKIANLKSSKGDDVLSQSIKEEIVKKENEINKLKSEDFEKHQELLNNNPLLQRKNDLYNEREKLIDKKTELFKEQQALEFKLTSKNKELDERNKKRGLLINEFITIEEKIKNPLKFIEHSCPVCHREFEEKDINERINHYVEELNTSKQKILEEGAKNKKETKFIEEEISELNSSLTNIEKQLSENNSKFNELVSEINKLNETPAPAFNSNPKIEVLTNEVKELNQKLIDAKNELYNSQKEINDMILEEEQKVETYRKVIADYDYYKRQQQNLELVKAEKEKHSSELTNLEQKREYINKFVYTKLKMLDENVSKVFGNIKFQLIKENINGGFDAICKPYIYDIDKDKSTDVSWKSGSKSERVVTGIAIAEKIKEHLQLPNLPYLFDEGGEISTETFESKFKTNSQIICVKVQDNIIAPQVVKIK